MKKKPLVILLCVLLVASLSACNSGAGSDTGSAPDPGTTAPPPVVTPPPEPEADTDPLASLAPTPKVDYATVTLPEAQESTFVLKDFKFHTGEVLPEVTVNYLTLGDPANEAVLFLHGTAGAGQSMLSDSIAKELFGPGQPLDAAKYYIILPDAIGTGKSTTPSDGLKAAFPLYNYDDMVQGQYRLVTEGLGVTHLRLVIGFSMGGMQTWMWGETYPDFMDAIVPMAATPTAMAGRNWMTRRMLTDAIRNDPAWKDGNYTEQPQEFRLMNVYYNIATNGGSLAYLEKAPTTEKANELYESMLGNLTQMDANDFLYQWDSSRDYDPEPNLGKITAWVLAINSADDERNPYESGLMDRSIEKLPHGFYYLVPGSGTTGGHVTVLNASLWKAQLIYFLEQVPDSGK